MPFEPRLERVGRSLARWRGERRRVCAATPMPSAPKRPHNSGLTSADLRAAASSGRSARMCSITYSDAGCGGNRQHEYGIDRQVVEPWRDETLKGEQGWIVHEVHGVGPCAQKHQHLRRREVVPATATLR